MALLVVRLLGWAMHLETGRDQPDVQHEGAPYVVDELGRVVRVHTGYGGIGGHGRGLCACGALSPLLDSAHQRKAWHREHKREVAE